MTEAPPNSVAPDDSAKKSQILDGARRVFLAAGYEGASMSAIAREAGVSKGTLYVYFENKEALFSAFIESECRLRAAGVFDVLDTNEPAERVLSEFGRLFLTFKLSGGPHAIERLIIAESAKFPELGRAFYNAGPKIGGARLTAYLRRRIEAGELDIDDPTLAADQFMNLCLADLMLKRRMSVIETATPQRVAYIADGAARVFLKAYRARSHPEIC